MIQLKLPAPRERPEDIPLLAEYFLSHSAARLLGISERNLWYKLKKYEKNLAG